MPVVSRQGSDLRIVALVATLALAACQDAQTPSSPAAVSAAPQLDRTTAGETSDLGNQLAALRRATVTFRDTAAASAAGYDAKLTPCWYYGSLGAMGYHYGNPDLIDGTADLWHPEILVYAPTGEGGLGLAALEYIVPIPAWTGATPPSLLGREFERNDALGIYALHVWLWRHNPLGTFADWNPNVSCAHAPDSEDRS